MEKNNKTILNKKRQGIKGHLKIQIMLNDKLFSKAEFLK